MVSKLKTIGIIIIILALGIPIFAYDCEISETETIKSKEEGFSGNYYSFFIGLKNILGCEKQDVGLFDKGLFWTKEVLGFNQDILDFFPELLTGLIIGALLFSVYFLAQLFTTFKLGPFKEQAELDAKKMSRGWLSFLASSPWKIIPVGIAYAVIMQVPLINRFIEIISFEILGLSDFIRAIILAFYIGLIPGIIEYRARYKIRQHYYERILQTKYGAQGMRSVVSG